MSEPHSQRELAIIREGMKACDQDIPKTDNPYSVDNWKHYAWLAGWYAHMAYALRRNK